MCTLVILTIFINILMYCNAVEINYVKPKFERNNILNKGLWTKEKTHDTKYGDFIFNTDAGDLDSLLQNNFDAFGQNFMDTIPVFSNYVERNKRSTIHKQNKRIRKSLKNCDDKVNCLKQDDDTQSLYKSKFISQLRPASVYNDYPYEVAVLLATSNKRKINQNYTTKTDAENIIETNKTNEYIVPGNKLGEKNKTEVTILKPLEDVETLFHNNKSIINIPKRRTTLPEFKFQTRDKTSVVEINNKTKHIDGNKIHRNVFDKEEVIWQSAPVRNVVLPRPGSDVKNKHVTEKGLVKVLALLTKTFKKVMKQHNEIQDIDNKLHHLNENFMKNVAALDTKFQEFDTKYTNLIGIYEKISSINEKFIKKSEDLEQKETGMLKNLREFENQQKNFLAQQSQFYTIQKFMLDQNEKVNRKQSLIAKTQSDISRRQNHFARVLKKAKQLYLDNKYHIGSKLSSIINKTNNLSTLKTYKNLNKIIPTTPNTSVSTDSVKINLFSIPKLDPLPNYDNLILEEKNDHPIDDLVYKYYFNNTFLDNIMKSKILTALIDNEGKNTRNIKNKRNDLTNQTTLLLPIANANLSPIERNLQRERRWIRHPSKSSRKYHRQAAGDETLQKSTKIFKNKVNEDSKVKNDPFLIMATNFCNEVGQNLHKQMLNWCVEKSLRKLKSIDMMFSMKPLAPPPLENMFEKLQPIKVNDADTVSETTKLFPLTETAQPMYSANLAVISTPETLKRTFEDVIITEKSDLFFPDNDELESNLKQYEVKPDPEGTIYFDGSLHTSDIVISESEALSDVMPGLDSNSHVDVDPLALDLQARRRAYVRRLNENIMKRMHS